MKKAVCYLRRSTKNQQLSFEMQHAWISEFALKNGYELVGEFVDDKSGRTNDRAGFLAAIDYVSKPENSDVFLICGRICRIARNLGSLHYLEPVLSRIRSAHLGDVEINEMLMAVLLAISKGESDAISARVKQAYKSLKVRNPAAPWGCRSGLIEGRKKSLSNRAQRADAYACRIFRAVSLIDSALTLTWHERLERLDELGIRSSKGGALSVGNLHRAYHRGLRSQSAVV
jgi:DNA invertase Pin-like site-specific DNA recombinase